MSMTQKGRQGRSVSAHCFVRRTFPNDACTLHDLPYQHDIPTSSVDANLQLHVRSLTAPWDTRRHISNHVDAALAVAAGRTT